MDSMTFKRMFKSGCSSMPKIPCEEKKAIHIQLDLAIGSSGSPMFPGCMYLKLGVGATRGENGLVWRFTMWGSMSLLVR